MHTYPNIEILSETPQFLVINKPPGLIVEHSAYFPSVEDWVFDYLRTKQPRKEPFVGIVHRLDRVVSGVLLIAKKKSYLKAFNEQFRTRNVVKTYLALIASAPPKPKGLLKHWLVIDQMEKKSTAFDQNKKGSVEVSLSYKIVSQVDGKCLLEIDLHTGKFHQIRAQLAAIGCPIIGDLKYGSTVPFHENAIALHAHRLQVVEPMSDGKLVFESAFPY